jgi:ubiquinone/menaquinone biosynthesis C-methylase UbiE
MSRPTTSTPSARSTWIKPSTPGANVWRWRGATPPTSILHLGTGTGQVALLLAELSHRMTGIDLAESMLDLARALG